MYVIFTHFSGRRKHVVLGKRVLKNIGGQVNKQIEDFRIALLELRKAFLDEATITTEITALQILDDMGIISANIGGISSQLDGMATRLKWVSSQVSFFLVRQGRESHPSHTRSRVVLTKCTVLHRPLYFCVRSNPNARLTTSSRPLLAISPTSIHHS